MRLKLISKNDMIEVAQRLIRDEGLNKCSMRRISKELGIASGTVYNYYNTREALLKDVFIVSWKKTVENAQGTSELDIKPFDKLQGIYQIIWKDVKSRNGLGKEIFLSKDLVCTEERRQIEKELMCIIEAILAETLLDSDTCQTLSRWFFLIFLVDSINDQRITEVEWKLIHKLMQP